jgi:hypothetical protein
MRVLLPRVLPAQIRPAVRVIDLAHHPVNAPAAATRARFLGRVGRARPGPARERVVLRP